MDVSGENSRFIILPKDTDPSSCSLTGGVRTTHWPYEWQTTCFATLLPQCIASPVSKKINNNLTFSVESHSFELFTPNFSKFSIHFCLFLQYLFILLATLFPPFSFYTQIRLYFWFLSDFWLWPSLLYATRNFITIIWKMLCKQMFVNKNNKASTVSAGVRW